MYLSRSVAVGWQRIASQANPELVQDVAEQHLQVICREEGPGTRIAQLHSTRGKTVNSA